MLRLSMIYALMDRSETINLPHLKAALALWDYSEQSVKMIFEEMTGDENVDLVVKCGKAFKHITRSQLWKLLGHNTDNDELGPGRNRSRGEKIGDHRSATQSVFK